MCMCAIVPLFCLLEVITLSIDDLVREGMLLAPCNFVSVGSFPLTKMEKNWHRVNGIDDETVGY